MANADSPIVRFRLWFSLLPPALRVLIAVNGVLYVAWLLLGLVPAVAEFMRDHLALTPRWAASIREPWQLVTQVFVNLNVGLWGFISFVFALAWLNWIGRDYEEFYGSHRLFGLYVLAGVMGGLFALAVGGLRPWPELFRVSGAWAPTMGVLCAVAVLHPERSIGLFLLGAVPLKWVAIGVLVLSAFNPFQLPAMLGAAFMGAIFARAQQGGVDLAGWARPLFERKPRAAKRAPTPAAARAGAGRRWFGGEEDEPRGEGRAPGERPARPRADREAPAPRKGRVAQSEVDRILDKISERGLGALTDEERRVLEEASRRK